MPRVKKVRRFDPRGGVSVIALEEEGKWLRKEIEGYEVLSVKEIETKCNERFVLCERTWQHLQKLLEDVPEKDRRLLQCLVFRDLYHILELYRHYLKPELAESPTPRLLPQPVVLTVPPERFTGFLFEL